MKEMVFLEEMKNVKNVKTILGLIDEYSCINGLVDLNNPAISKAIYKHEQVVLSYFVKASITAADYLC